MANIILSSLGVSASADLKSVMDTETTGSARDEDGVATVLETRNI